MMGGGTKILRIVGKSLGVVVLIAMVAVVATSISPIYRFAEPQPFAGEAIFNPYRNYNATWGWQRAAFHVHTRVEGLFNECEYWPEEVVEEYNRYGYDIVAFSNHNEITLRDDPALQVSLYEHGYNLLKYHKLIFGSERVRRFDHLLPLLASQKQWQIELLAEDSDLVQLNHPLRTHTLAGAQLTKLGGYEIMELDSGKSTENEYWDIALSAGHYSFGMANDDLHYPNRSTAIAMRCNMLNCASASYDDILATLRDGCFYAMRLPDYGAGDWSEKERRNSEIPYIESIGMRGDSIYISLSAIADSIKFTGAGHATLATAYDSRAAEYVMRKEDSYARITAYMPEGEVIYTNPFARYDKAAAKSPFRDATHSINWPLTLLFNLGIALVVAALIRLIFKILRR